MNIDELKARVPNENASKQFFKFIIWRYGRNYTHCWCYKDYSIKSHVANAGDQNA